MKSLTVHASGGGFHREVVSVGPKRFTGEDKTLLIPINGVSTPPGHIDKLWFTFQTGDDDLRGVNDNVNILIHYRGGQTQSVENANNGHRWPDNTTHQVEVGLNGAVLPSDIVQIDLRTTFTGGMGGDNWNMDSLSVRATGNGVDKVLVTHGFKRFTGDDKFLALPVVIANEEGHDAVWLGWQDLGGTIKAPPAVASWAAHRLDVFSAGMDGKLNHKWWDGSTWHNWETLGGVFKGAPAAVSWGPNRIDVFVRGMDDHLGHLWWNGSQWNGWEDLGGPISSAPAVASWGTNRLDVFAAGSDGHLHRKWWNGSKWSDWDRIGGVFHDNPAAVSWGPNRIDVFVHGMDDHLGHLWCG